MTTEPQKLPFSKILQTQTHVYLSGTVGTDPRNGEIPASVSEQTRLILNDFRKSLESVGYSLQNIAKITIFLTDMGDFAELNVAYREFFAGMTPPARTCVAVCALPNPAAKVEMDLIAEAA